MNITRRTLMKSVSLGAAMAMSAPSVLRAQTAKIYRLGITTPPGHPWNLAAEAVGKRLAEETNGRLAIQVFPSNQLGNEGAMLQQMQSGALDLGWIMTAELGSRIPQIAAINAPWLVKSTEKVAALVRHPTAIKLLDVLPAQTGTIGLGYGITTLRVVFTGQETAGIEDIKGMKLRINTTPAYRDFYQLLGAAPTPIPTPQVFDAMSNGQVDGLEADLDLSWNQRYDKVAKTMLRMNAIFMPCVALASGRIWKGVPEADRELIARLTREQLDKQIDATVAKEATLLQNFKNTGIKIVDIDLQNTAEIIAAYDQIWLPKAPVLKELREVGASL
ncbi:TRAP transporter substrate-binding protein [Ensifer sp. T173]|uniref:TRAP transporter substrate-binding protein n=1 Tax=Ensifer canadensis TaxID=555315 RepID=A0AAW4FH36_9HYPH|nr:TRAP transporter substrate-binding protein [Ensifer canadensis]MBM3091407.1 TRAP transporter substrate-binding protein [Ensifer canadensis]UBI78916.1 TRAP transporter substrate-binding protein [Ensifer canadensis]